MVGLRREKSLCLFSSLCFPASSVTHLKPPRRQRSRPRHRRNKPRHSLDPRLGRRNRHRKNRQTPGRRSKPRPRRTLARRVEHPFLS